MKERKVNRFIFWTPRILTILFIFFMALMSLDVFSSASSPGEVAVGLLMHNIPTLVLLVVLLISWKYEIVGGVVFILAGLMYVFMARNVPDWRMAVSWSLTIAGPAFLIGILYLLNWTRKKK